MSKNTTAILIAGLLSIAGIVICAMLQGYDNQLVTGAISGVVAITTGVVGYQTGKRSAGKNGGTGGTKPPS